MPTTVSNMSIVPSLTTSGSSMLRPGQAKQEQWQKQPGLTASNKKRIFVSHDYQDLSGECPIKQDTDWVNFFYDKPLDKQPFPLKLFLALERADQDGLGDSFGWLAHGRAFKIYDRDLFKSKILSTYLGMNNYASFLRQCSLYSFRRLTRASGVESYGAHYCELFLKGRPHLLRRMKRTKVKGTRIRPAASFKDEPEFFKMASCSTSAWAIDGKLVQKLQNCGVVCTSSSKMPTTTTAVACYVNVNKQQQVKKCIVVATPSTKVIVNNGAVNITRKVMADEQHKLVHKMGAMRFEDRPFFMLEHEHDSEVVSGNHSNSSLDAQIQNPIEFTSMHLTRGGGDGEFDKVAAAVAANEEVVKHDAAAIVPPAPSASPELFSSDGLPLLPDIDFDDAMMFDIFETMM